MNLKFLNNQYQFEKNNISDFLNATDYKKLYHRRKRSNSTKENNGTCVIKGKHNSTNVVGIVGEPDFAVTRFPYLLDSCDQVVLLHGFMVQSENFFNSTPAYLSLSAYMVNLFEKKNSKNLIKSITLDKILEIPKIIKGAPLCTSFKSKDDEINFCLKSSHHIENIITDFKEFIACRKGISIKHCKLYLENLIIFNFKIIFLFLFQFILCK